MEKLVYRDGDYTKVLRGQCLNEDEQFLRFKCDEHVYRINKKDIVSIRERAEDGNEKENP